MPKHLDDLLGYNQVIDEQDQPLIRRRTMQFLGAIVTDDGGKTVVDLESVGPTGPAGPIGATGPTGPAGATGAAGSSTVTPTIYAGGSGTHNTTGVSGIVFATGGGGAGGSVDGGGAADDIAAGGGGGGGTSIKFYPVLPASFEYSVGIGGIAFTGTTGGSGQNSFLDDGTVTVIGGGGQGGTRGPDTLGEGIGGLGGNGGGSAGGDLNLDAPSGLNGFKATPDDISGAGGRSMFGAGGSAVQGDAAGLPGKQPGGGGSGACMATSATNAGGAGSSGQIIILEFGTA